MIPDLVGTVLQTQVLFPAIKGFPEFDNLFPAVSPEQIILVVGTEFFYKYTGARSCSSG